MCNNYKLEVPAAQLAMAFEEPLQYPGGVPNLEPRADIRIGDQAPVVMRGDNGLELRTIPWAWRSPQGRPVFNFRSEGRDFSSSRRCLIPADGFYEFTDPEPGHKRKTKWLFTRTDGEWFWIAGVIRDEAFAMLTTEPGPDVAPYHDRQIVLLSRMRGIEWLDTTRPSPDLSVPLETGRLAVTKMYPLPIADAQGLGS